MKFNMGCGHNRIEGFVNVDSSPVGGPDQVWDLEQTPWPWETGCAEEVLFIHSLEHMGADPKVFLAIMSELYRIAAPGCIVTVHVPHPRHDSFLNDPTHVRPITGQVLALFDRELNDMWQAKGSANSPLAHYTGVDFAITAHSNLLAAPYDAQFTAGEITPEQLERYAEERNNVIQEIRVTMVARKPA